MRVKLDQGAIKPVRAHEDDAGYDIYSRETAVVPARGSRAFNTGVHIELPDSIVPVGEKSFIKFKTVGFLKHRR